MALTSRRIPSDDYIHMLTIALNREHLLHPDIRHIFRFIFTFERREYLRAQKVNVIVGGDDGGGNVVRFLRLEVTKFNQRLVRLTINEQKMCDVED